MKRQTLVENLLNLTKNCDNIKNSHDALWFASGVMEQNAINDCNNHKQTMYSALEVYELLMAICEYKRES